MFKKLDPKLIPMRFIGRDGSMGLRKNETYLCSIFSSDGYIYVAWRDGKSACPYWSIKSLGENWEVVR